MLAAAVSLAGCTTGSSEQSGTSLVQQAPATGPESVPESIDGRSADDASALVQQDRSIVTTGSITVTADDPIDAAEEAVRIVEGVGGRIDARTETAPTKGNRGAATLTLRVPSATLTATVHRLKALGTNENVALTSVDVTTQVQDLDARISALRASVDRLTALLSTATDTEVLIKLETAISERQGNLESMEAQQRGLADQVSLSTIELSLVSVADAPVQTPDTFWSGLAAGWAAFTGFVGFLLVAAGVLLPWLAVAAVAAGITVLVVRLRRRAAAGNASRSEPPSAS